VKSWITFLLKPWINSSGVLYINWKLFTILSSIPTLITVFKKLLETFRCTLKFLLSNFFIFILTVTAFQHWCTKSHQEECVDCGMLTAYKHVACIAHSLYEFLWCLKFWSHCCTCALIQQVLSWLLKFTLTLGIYSILLTTNCMVFFYWKQ